MDIQLSVTVPKELNDVLTALTGLVVAIKAGTPVATLIETELPILIGLIGELGAAVGEVTAESGPALDAALLQARALVSALLGK